MKRKDAVLAAVTVFSMAFGVTSLVQTLPGGPHGQAVVASPRDQPCLESDGVVFSLKTQKAVYIEGEAPVVVLDAVNKYKRKAQMSLKLTMMTAPPSDPMARMVAMPESTWTTECLVRLEPGESRSYEFPTHVPLKEGNRVHFVIESGQSSMMAGHLFVRPENPSPEAVALFDLLDRVNGAQ